jgi:predicted acetyltransferase
VLVVSNASVRVVEPLLGMTPDLVVATRPSSIRAMMTPYLYELTPQALPVYPRLGLYWEDRNRLPYLIRVGGDDAGFALVRHHADTGFHEMAEFYVAPEHRRQGIGRAAARALLDRHPGWWHLQVLDDNAPAQAFWRDVMPPPVHAVHRQSSNGRRFTVMQFRTGSLSA